MTTPSASRYRTLQTEVIRQRGPWRGLDDVEYAALEWVHWYNNKHLLESIGYVPPVEHEAKHYQEQQAQPTAAGLN